MFVFRKIWRALFSWNTRFEIRPFALLPKNCLTKLLTIESAFVNYYHHWRLRRHLLVQSQQWNHQNNVWNLFKVSKQQKTPVSLFLTLNKFHTLLCCFLSQIWTSKCQPGGYDKLINFLLQETFTYSEVIFEIDDIY